MSVLRKTRGWRSTAAVAGAATAALLLAACGGGDDAEPGTSSSSDTASSSAPAPKSGGALTILEGGDIRSWDPKTQNSTSPGLAADRLNAVFGQLVYTDAQGKVQGGMAESLTTDDVGATWVLKLRDGVMFTDDTPYDAAAVKANWDRIAADPTAVAQSLASTFTTEVTDPTTLTITPQTPDPVLDLRIAELLPHIASPASLEGAGDDYQPVGAGPFTLVSWDLGVGEEFAKNPNYWDTGKPYLDTLKTSIVADPAQRVTTVVQGGAEIMNGYLFQFRNEAEGSDQVATTEVPAGGLRTVLFNTEVAPFDDVRARQAMTLAMDATELSQTLTQDPSYEGANTLFPESSPYYDSSLSLPTKDVAAAQSLVDELAADGKPFDVNVLYPSIPELTRAAEYVQSALAELTGVTVTLTPIEIPDWRTTADAGDYNITFYPGVVDLNGAEVSMTGLLGTGGADNITNYSSPEMDAALDEARTATDDAAKVAAFKKVQEIYLQDVPLWVFGIDYRNYFHRSDVGGMVPVGRGNLLPQELFLTD